MKMYSKKRTAYNRQAKKSRDEYREKFPQCQYPGCKCNGQDVHEISRGTGRKDSLIVWAALLHLCRLHHRTVQGMPIVAQLGVKKLSRSGYDRVAVNNLRGRADESISEWEVNDWILRGKLS